MGGRRKSLAFCGFILNLLLFEAVNFLPGNILIYEFYFPTFVGCGLHSGLCILYKSKMGMVKEF